MAGGIFFLWWGVQTQWQEWGREAGGLSVPCGGCLVCLLKKWAETGPSEGFQARTQSAYGRKIIKISSVVGAVPCFRPFFELADHAPGTRNRKPARLPSPLPETNKSRGCVPSCTPLLLTPTNTYYQIPE